LTPRFFLLRSVPQTPTAPRAVRGIGPAIILVLIIGAALLGYYQFVYYPSVAVNTSSSSIGTTTFTVSTASATPFNATITILNGAPSAIRDLTFSPDVATVYLGYNSTVVWINNDASKHTITANSSDQSVDPNFYAWSNVTGFNDILPKGSPGDTLTFTFTVAGTYGYFCRYHSNMIGTLIVKPAPPGLLSATQTSSASTTTSTTT
jgi:plastocyanin